MVGLITVLILMYLDYRSGSDFKVEDLWPFLCFVLLWPVFLIILSGIWLNEKCDQGLDKFGEIKQFVLIKGKKTEKENKSQEEVVNEFEEGEGDC